MLVFYRGHVITLLVDQTISAEITEQNTSAPLPTKVTASLKEGEDICVERAKALIDVYLSALPSG